VRGDHPRAEAMRLFYDEYTAVMDLSGRFLSADGSTGLPGARAAPRHVALARPARRSAAIERTALLTIEGERDDICAPGQTVAAHTLCGLLPATKEGAPPAIGGRALRHLQWPRWRSEIYPRLRDFISTSGKTAASDGADSSYRPRRGHEVGPATIPPFRERSAPDRMAASATSGSPPMMRRI